MNMKPPPIHASTVYLCQIGPDISCGACCGLYNVADPSRENLEAMLLRRTRWFAETARDVAAMDAFKARVEKAESGQRPFPEFHHCAFLGMIEDRGRRVGCLLHPLAKGNHGVDWRGLSYYGGMACRSYFCPSVRQLPARWLNALRAGMNNWYLHGLIVTERRMLHAFFEELESRLGRCLRESDFSGNDKAVQLLRRFARLKATWPFRRRQAAGVCNYFFEDGLYPRSAVGFPGNSKSPASFGILFRELDSGFSSSGERQQAEQILEDLFERMVQALDE
jgi:hypothetical protein